MIRALGGVLSLGLLAASTAAAAPLVPDMQTRPLPTSSPDIYIQGPSSDKELRFSNAWANHGAGPWETAPAGPGNADDCDGDGNFQDDVIVNQRLYEDGDADGVFDREIDTATTERPAGCMVFHPLHDHFHIEDAGRYSLLREPTGEPAAASSKVSFCLLDVTSFDLALDGAPPTPYYSGCDQTVQGISVGWYDKYGAGLAGQDIDLDDVTAGNYCLRSEFDPDDLFLETDETNNVAERRYHLDPATEEVTPLSGSCILTDTTAPETKISRGPKRNTHDRTPKFVFAAGEESSFECKLDRRPWRPCSSPKAYKRLSLGRHRFRVTATDLAGHVEAKPAKRRFEIVARG